MARTALRVVLLALLVVTGAAAQSDGTSHWGVTATFVPSWKVASNAKFLYDADSIDIGGGEFSIGVARGRSYGGDWGITYIRRSFSDGSYVDKGFGTFCFVASASCVDTGTHYSLGNVVLNGIEGHKFVSFATIKRRVQVGMIFGGGVAWADGVVEGTYRRVELMPGGPVIVEGTEQVKYTDLFLGGHLSVVPLAQVEVAVNAILAPGLKARFSGGYNFPGYNVARISIVYLIGSH